MKITAKFYSVDDAEFAAAAIRRNSDGIFDITVNERPTNARRDREFAPMGFFSSLGTGSQSAVPVPAAELTADSNLHEAKDATIEIICRSSEAKRVGGAIISHGGHELRGM